MKRFLIILVAAAMAFVGFAPGASAETDDATTPERCERQEQIEQRLSRKMDKIAAKADRIELHMERVAQRIENLDPEKKNAEKRAAKAERRMERLEKKAAKNMVRAERVEAKLAKLIDECGAGEMLQDEMPIEMPEEESPVEELPEIDEPLEDQIG